MTSTSLPTTGRLAGVDYGTVRIGIALTDPDQRFASPFEIHTRRSPAIDATYFKKLAVEERLVGFVVGLPVHGNGNESQKSWESRQFGEWLTQLTALPVVFFDERYTTAIAEQILGQAEFTKKRRKERLDKLAAQILLTAYLEAGDSRGAPPGALDDENHH